MRQIVDSKALYALTIVRASALGLIMKEKNLSGLFINCVEAKDSIFESGKMVFECLSGSDKYSLDYVELTPENTTLSTDYDFYFFNYHHITMAWLDTESIKKLLPGAKITMVLEVSPNNPFIYCPPNDFDYYIPLDPTLKLNKNNVFPFPRPLEKFEKVAPYQEKEIPVIGSFGFATPGKGFEHVIDAVNREFDRAKVRINIPYADYTDEGGKYAKELAQMCKDRAKNGIEVVVTHDFMSKPELLNWCGENTLNCFLYDRNQPGLAATTDQAITSGRPLITSKNNTFRHIQKYIKPFPYQSLQNAIKNTPAQVQQIQRDWSAENFRTMFETEVLGNIEFNERPKVGETVTLPLLPPNRIPQPPTAFQNLRDNAAVKTRVKNLIKGKGFKRIVEPEPEPLISHSQFGEDVIVYNLLTDIPIKSLLYLDIGANNPEFINNTFLFYEKGFQGVLVEPNPFLCGKLAYARPRDTVVNYGIGIDETIKEADFYIFSQDADGLSTFSADEAKHWEEVGLDGRKHKIERVWKMPLMGINEVIEKYFTECPDFISIDVEGWDFQILQTFDFEKYSPTAFCVETLAYNKDGSTYRITEINDFFESHGYFSFQETYANNIFVNKNLYDFYLYQKAIRDK